MNEYECIPLWALMNVLNFGTTVYFNYCMKWQDKLPVANRFNLSRPDFNRVLRALGRPTYYVGGYNSSFCHPRSVADDTNR
jgi:abortive infection bacteriophage resistance protein